MIKELRRLDLEPDMLVDDDVETEYEMMMDEVCSEDNREDRMMVIDDMEAGLEATMMETEMETKDDLMDEMTTEDTMEDKHNPEVGLGMEMNM